MLSSEQTSATGVPECKFCSNGAVQLAVHRWREVAGGRPALLLTHGTGFCGAVWLSVARAHSADFVVYAIDRRGHGASSKPDAAYHFTDFAYDVVNLIDALQPRDAYAVGHSAGATDLLLAAVLRPRAFHTIFALEPTVMDAAAPIQRVDLQATRDERLDAAARRRAVFASFEAACEHYRTRPPFRAWRPELLAAYVRHGFDEPLPRCDRRAEVGTALLLLLRLPNRGRSRHVR